MLEAQAFVPIADVIAPLKDKIGTLPVLSAHLEARAPFFLSRLATDTRFPIYNPGWESIRRDACGETLL